MISASKMPKMKVAWPILILFLLVVVEACSSAPYKKQNYAQLPSSKFFEEEFPVVWKGIQAALGEYKIEEQDMNDGEIVTDWVYSTSNEKYVEYKVNGVPRKHYLQARYKFKILADKQIGGVKVTVQPNEEIEKLKSDGSFDGWHVANDQDTNRANEMLRGIELKILSRLE